MSYLKGYFKVKSIALLQISLQRKILRWQQFWFSFWFDKHNWAVPFEVHKGVLTNFSRKGFTLLKYHPTPWKLTLDPLEVDLNSNQPLDFSMIYKLPLEDR